MLWKASPTTPAALPIPRRTLEMINHDQDVDGPHDGEDKTHHDVDTRGDRFPAMTFRAPKNESGSAMMIANAVAMTPRRIVTIIWPSAVSHQGLELVLGA